VTILCFLIGCVALGLGLLEWAVPGTAGTWLRPSAPTDAAFLLILLAALLLRLNFATTAEYIHDEDNASIPRSQSISFALGNLHLPLRGQNHPALPAYFVKVSSVLFGTTPLGYRLVHVLAGLGTIVMMFLLARQWFGPVAARWSAALLAFNEYYMGVSSRATAHVPYLLFTGAAICAFGRFVATERPAYLYATGAALGVAFYAKEHAALLLPVFLLMLLHPKYRHWFRGPHVYLAPVVFLLVIAPDLFWNLTAREGTAQATYADHLQRIGGMGFSPYPLMFYARDAVQGLYSLVTDKGLFDPTSEYLSVNPALGLLLLGAVLVTTVRGAAPVGNRFFLLVFWGVFGFFTSIRPGDSPKDLDPASWIWVDVTLFPAVILAGALLAGVTGRARYAAWIFAGGALLYAGAGMIG
jgi:4-amino-4-deoxy-L-arabinose transferase-like glycosyltransferase